MKYEVLVTGWDTGRNRKFVLGEYDTLAKAKVAARKAESHDSYRDVWVLRVDGPEVQS